MIVATPGDVGEGEETTATFELGCDAGPEGLMGVTTGRNPFPQPAAKAATRRTAPADAVAEILRLHDKFIPLLSPLKASLQAISGARPLWFRSKSMGERLIQFRSCLLE
jgi:hypothetical protein